MRLLLDSQVLLWWALGSTRLTEAARELIADASSVSVSLVTPWELKLKAATGRLTLPEIDWRTLDRRGIDLVPILLDDVLVSADLPRHHRDPFDRMIIAQALNREMTIVTSDALFGHYNVAVVRG